MFALVESAFRVVDFGNVAKIVEKRRPPQITSHGGLPTVLRKDIRDAFYILDTNRDGLVSRQQVQNLLYRIDPDTTDDEMEDLLDAADLDGDGMYDMDEYIFLMYLKWNDQESVDDIKEAFKIFDKDDSGALSRDEFAYILRKLGEPLTDAEVDEILNYFDRDGSGEIDFDEFAYVMTGPHLNDQGKFDHGIPLKSANAKDRLMPPSHASQTHGRKHSKKKRKSRKEGKSSSTSKSGKKATSSDQEAGRTSKPESKRSQIGKMMLKSAAELRPLQTIRPLMGGKLVIPEKPKGDTSGLLRADTVIERYHDLYGKKSPGGKRKSHGGDEVRSHSSVDSDFSMCSDVIRNMSIHPAHYTPDSDEEDYV